MTRSEIPVRKRRRRRAAQKSAQSVDAAAAAQPSSADEPAIVADPSEIIEEIDHQADGLQPDAPGQVVADFVVGAAIGSVLTIGAFALGRVVQSFVKRAPPPPPPRRPSAPPRVHYAPPPPPPRWTPPASSWAPPPPPPPPRRAPRLDEDDAAAALLGVGVDADEAEIRAAHKRIVRDRMKASGFGDTAADQTETVRINAARQRLLERARRRGGAT